MRAWLGLLALSACLVVAAPHLRREPGALGASPLRPDAAAGDAAGRARGPDRPRAAAGPPARSAGPGTGAGEAAAPRSGSGGSVHAGAAPLPPQRGPRGSLDDESAATVVETLARSIEAARRSRELFVGEGVVERLARHGSVRVIVAQRGPDRRLEPRLAGARHGPARYYRHIPFAALEVGPQALLELVESDDIGSIEADGVSRPGLIESVPLIGADRVHAAGYEGGGFTVVVMDTGIDPAHPFLADHVVDEACFTSSATCPNGQTRMFGPGAGAMCSYGCGHGTAVAGIALGSHASTTLLGVAPAASLIVIQVFSDDAGEPSAYTSDVVAALEHVYDLRLFHRIAAVNMSFGGESFASEAACDAANPARRAAVDLLRSVGIASIASAGNDGYTDLVNAPACISSVIGVGSASKRDVVSDYSNSAGFLSLLAPGESIHTSKPGGGYGISSGTSMAAPHVSGAFALIRSASPGSGVAQILFALQATGLPIRDPRNSLSIPRIDVAEAIAQLGGDVGDPDPGPPPEPPSAALAPSGGRACGLVGLELLLPLIGLRGRWRAVRGRRSDGAGDLAAR